jgi:hypothetical protein
MQIGSGSDLEPKTKTLEYWDKSGPGWYDAGGFLDGQDGGPLGEWVALDVSPASDVVMAWTRRDTIEGVPQPQQIWMARPHEPSDVPPQDPSLAAPALSIWPNPFNPQTEITFEMPAAGFASLRIFDLSGRLVRTLESGQFGQGVHTSFWQGKNDAGRGTASGVYLAVLQTSNGLASRRLTLAR